MWLDTPPGGYYQPYQVAQTYTWTWAHVNPRPPIGDRCSYTAGDGTGGTEAKIGSYSSADACARAVADGYPQANGATYSATPGNGACYAEYSMTEHNDNPAWVTCLFGGFAPYAPPAPPPIACHQACNGGNDGCGGNLGLGDGDCDNDADCAQGLVCGTDNCMLFRTSAGWPNDGPGWDMTDDCPPMRRSTEPRTSRLVPDLRCSRPAGAVSAQAATSTAGWPPRPRRPRRPRRRQ